MIWSLTSAKRRDGETLHSVYLLVFLWTVSMFFLFSLRTSETQTSPKDTDIPTGIMWFWSDDMTFGTFLTHVTRSPVVRCSYQTLSFLPNTLIPLRWVTARSTAYSSPISTKAVPGTLFMNFTCQHKHLQFEMLQWSSNVLWNLWEQSCCGKWLKETRCGHLKNPWNKEMIREPPAKHLLYKEI